MESRRTPVQKVKDKTLEQIQVRLNGVNLALDNAFGHDHHIGQLFYEALREKILGILGRISTYKTDTALAEDLKALEDLPGLVTQFVKDKKVRDTALIASLESKGISLNNFKYTDYYDKLSASKKSFIPALINFYSELAKLAWAAGRDKDIDYLESEVKQQWKDHLSEYDESVKAYMAAEDSCKKLIAKYRRLSSFDESSRAGHDSAQATMRASIRTQFADKTKSLQDRLTAESDELNERVKRYRGDCDHFAERLKRYNLQYDLYAQSSLASKPDDEVFVSEFEYLTKQSAELKSRLAE